MELRYKKNQKLQLEAVKQSERLQFKLTGVSEKYKQTDDKRPKDEKFREDIRKFEEDNTIDQLKEEIDKGHKEMQNQAINDSFHASCDDSCSSDADKKDRGFQSDSDDFSPDFKSPAAPVTNLKGVQGLLKGNTMRAKKVMGKLAPQEDNKDEERIKEQTEEKRKSNIDKCMGGKDHAHAGENDDDYHGDKRSRCNCKAFKDVVIMCLMDILLFLFLCT